MKTVAPFKYLTSEGYFNLKTPAGYSCDCCGLSRVRLFRLPHGATCHRTGFELWCLRCGMFRTEKTFPSHSGDSPSDLLPAIPTEDGSAYWGVGNAPADAYRWWALQPLLTLDMLQSP